MILDRGKYCQGGKMKTAKSSYFGFGLFCLALAALAALQPHLPLWKNAAAEMPTESDILVLHLFFYFIAAVLLVIACSYLRTYVLTEEGIVHYFFRDSLPCDAVVRDTGHLPRVPEPQARRGAAGLSKGD